MPKYWVTVRVTEKILPAPRTVEATIGVNRPTRITEFEHLQEIAQAVVNQHHQNSGVPLHLLEGVVLTFQPLEDALILLGPNKLR